MKRVVNQSLYQDETWQEDGLTFTEVIKQEYTDCAFSAGSVERHPVDTVYLRWGRDDEDGGLLLLRPDELAAIAYIAAGLLWSLELAELDKRDGNHEL